MPQSKNRKHWLGVLLWVFILSFFQTLGTGCDLPPSVQPLGNSFITLASKEWKSFVSTLSRQLGLNPENEKTPEIQISPSPTVSVGQEISEASRRSKANSELLREMMSVVMMTDPKDRSEFGNWLDTLNQGASLEGVYNGLTHSSQFRTLEESHQGALPEAIKAFGKELAILEAELSSPTQFDEKAALPLPVMNPQGDLGNPTETVEFQGSAKQVHRPQTLEPSDEPTAKPKLDVNALAERYSKQFIGASIFTLKRVLGDEALKVIAFKLQEKESVKNQREKLADWYSKWVTHMTEWHVDFGVPLRNQADEPFHYKWAMENQDDRVRWEVLNRLHRVLNEANQMKQ